MFDGLEKALMPCLELAYSFCERVLVNVSRASTAFSMLLKSRLPRK